MYSKAEAMVNLAGCVLLFFLKEDIRFDMADINPGFLTGSVFCSLVAFDRSGTESWSAMLYGIISLTLCRLELRRANASTSAVRTK